MAEGDSIEQKSEASTIEMAQENGPKTKRRKPRSATNLSSKDTTCKVILLDGTEYESQVNVCAIKFIIFIIPQMIIYFSV